MYRDINNPNFSMFVKEDDSGGIPNEWDAMSNSSGHKSEAPIELWGDDAFVPIKQKDATPTPKKHEEKEKINPSKKQEGETQEQWAKRIRDNTAKKEKEASERAKKALSELNTLDKGEEEKHEPPNQYVKDTRGRKTIFTDDDNKKYLNKEDYRELVRLENEFRDGLFNTNSMDYSRLKKLRTTRSNNKKSGKTF